MRNKPPAPRNRKPSPRKPRQEVAREATPLQGPQIVPLPERFEIFLVALPGLEATIAEEAREAGFADLQTVPGGVSFQGGWPDVWRANLTLRCPGRVLVRLWSFRAAHLAQLDKRSRRLDWGAILPRGASVRVDAVCRRSKIYHDRAAAQRIATALKEEIGATVSRDAAFQVMLRIEEDLCTLSLDTSGALLHKRGFKTETGKAPMRETLAATFLRQCGYDGRMTLIDPMCGSGTFLIEAAEMAADLLPGRGRRFAFEDLVGFDREAFRKMATRTAARPERDPPLCFGFDRDAGAIRSSAANADRAGVATLAEFRQQPISDLAVPEVLQASGEKGLVFINPPYGDRIGEKGGLGALYNALGSVLKERFSGWRVGLVTNEAGLARATGLPFKQPGPPVPHGGLKIRLYQTDPLP